MKLKEIKLPPIVKIIIILVVIMILYTVVFINLNTDDSRHITVPDSELMLVVNKGKLVDKDGCIIDYYILVDSETGVEYYSTDSKYNRGTITPLYNADGTLKVLNGSKNDE